MTSSSQLQSADEGPRWWDISCEHDWSVWPSKCDEAGLLIAIFFERLGSTRSCTSQPNLVDRISLCSLRRCCSSPSPWSSSLPVIDSLALRGMRQRLTDQGRHWSLSKSRAVKYLWWSNYR